MTTPDNHQNEYSGKLERVLQGIQRKVTDIGAVVREMSAGVTELMERADAIYEAVTYHRDAPAYGPDDILTESDD